MESINPLIKPVENCFEEIKVKLSLQLPPMDTQNIISGTKSMLDRLVFKYKTELGGIIISYYDVVHTDKEAKIFYDSPYLSMNIQVKFLVFKPFKDQILNGVVKRVSSTHISLLVFGTISASIPKSNIPRTFAFDHSSNMFMNKQTKATISVGTKIAFKVLDVSADRHNIGIQGDMNDLTSTGIIGFEEVQNQFTQPYDTPNKAKQQQQQEYNSNSNLLSNNNNSNNENLTKYEDDSEKESEEEPKPIIVKVEPKIQVVAIKVESKKEIVKKEKETKKRKKVEPSSDESSSDSESSSEDEKEKKKKKKKSSTPSKKSKKAVVESSDSSSSEEEKEKKKKKKK